MIYAYELNDFSPDAPIQFHQCLVGDGSRCVSQALHGILGARIVGDDLYFVTDVNGRIDDIAGKVHTNQSHLTEEGLAMLHEDLAGSCSRQSFRIAERNGRDRLFVHRPIFVVIAHSLPWPYRL